MPCSPLMVPPSSTEAAKVSPTAARARLGVGAFAHEVDVDVAVAEVAEVDDEGVVPPPDGFDALDQLGHARARDDHVLVELERAELLDGRRERAPHVPQAVFVLARLRAEDVVAAQFPHHLFYQT